MEDERLVRDHIDSVRRWGIRERTLHHRRQALRMLARQLPTGLIHATREDLEHWQAGLRVAPSSLATYTVHVRSFYLWCEEAGRRADNPAARLRVPRVPRRLPRPIPEADLGLVLRTAVEPERTWFLLAGYCGLRAGEVARLRPCDVDVEHRILTVDGKGGRQRRVPVPPEVMTALRGHLRGQAGPIWRRPHGGPMVGQEVTRRTTGHFRGLGMGWTLHCCRHRFASEVYDTCADIRVVQELLGHQSLDSTQVYVQWSRRRAGDAVDRLGRRLRPRKRPVA